MSMKIIISPAKKMRRDDDGIFPLTTPIFLDKTQLLLDKLRSLGSQELQALWRCSDAIAEENIRRLENMDLHKELSPALLSYDGIQYQYMAPGVFEDGHYEYIGDYLRIVSGFYGLLRPFDGITPYRLEMQARLRVGEAKDLYSFWGAAPAKALAVGTDTLLDLCSGEYSKAILPHLPADIRIISCRFAEIDKGKAVEKGVYCKMARGQLVRWLAEHDDKDGSSLESFNGLGFTLNEELSVKDRYVYTRNKIYKK